MASYKAKIDYRETLVRRQDALQAMVKEDLLAKEKAAAAAPQGANAVTPLNPAVVDELKKTADLIERERTWFDPMMADVRSTEDRFAAEGQLIDKAGQALAAWAKSHAELKRALQENRKPNFREVIETALELRQLYEEVRKK